MFDEAFVFMNLTPSDMHKNKWAKIAIVVHYIMFLSMTDHVYDRSSVRL